MHQRHVSPLAPYGSYLMVWGGLWLILAWLLIWRGYEGSFLMVHHWRHPWLDWLMPHVTHLGDGLVLTALMALLLWRQSAAWWTLIGTMLLVGITVAFAKGVLFPDWGRPPLVFQGREEIIRLSLQPLLYQSFPSGHATAAAAAMGIPAFAWSRRYPMAGIVLAALAGLTAYSRVYIGVHFLGDILAGSLLGVGLGVLMYAGCQARLGRWLHRRSLTWQRRLRWWQVGLSVVMLILGVWRVWDRYYLA
jgi:undecaprenyl-diphosphatase